MSVLKVLLRPVITEKSTLLQESHKYVFQVAPGANKVEVREAIERAFDVKVRAVNIVKSRGAVRRVGNSGRIRRTKDVKKAVVTLRPGDSIPIFEGA
jgi:large subunit ribosomal protein L23